MSSLEDLKTILKEALDNKGITNEVKAKLRAEIFTILEDNSFEKPRLSQENLLINELIREYMDFNHYKYSKSVFLRESHQPPNPVNREIIAAELHVKEDNTSRQVPLIYTLVWDFLNRTQNEKDDDNRETSTNSNKLFQNSRETLKNKETSKNIKIYKYNQDPFD